MNENMGIIKYEELKHKEKIILYFFVYAFIGWCLETIYAYMIFKSFVKRGFLYGPICPIYGFGAILLILNLKYIKSDNNIAKFFVSVISFSIFEYIASFVLEVIFHQRWWDYSNDFMNIQGRICLIFSLLWGVIGVFFVNVLHPIVKKLMNNIARNIPISIKRIIIYSLGSVFIVDGILSIINHII